VFQKFHESSNVEIQDLTPLITFHLIV
jgi:hypothetical protein